MKSAKYFRNSKVAVVALHGCHVAPCGVHISICVQCLDLRAQTQFGYTRDSVRANLDSNKIPSRDLIDTDTSTIPYSGYGEVVVSEKTIAEPSLLVRDKNKKISTSIKPYTHILSKEEKYTVQGNVLRY